MKDIKIVSATSKKQENETLLYKNIDFYETQESENYIRYQMYCNNIESLAKVYNKELTLNNKDKIVLFVHDDVVIEDLFLVDKLNEAIQQFDIIGLAGIKAPIALKSPALWHLMGPPTQYSGAVAHFEKNGPRRFMTSFGPTPERVVLLDGVFLAINIERILEKGLKFDESNPAKFHFYDLNFCLDANKLGLKLGTWPIWVTHKSHGLEQTSKDWLVGQDYLLKKYT
jgi:hypothetical protein